MSENTLNIINCITQVLSAVATVAAVIVALYLSSSERRIILEVRAGIRSVVSMGQRISDAPEFICVEITNLSTRPVTITGFGWRVGILKKRLFAQLPDTTNPLSSKLPSRLNDGESAMFMIPMDNFVNELDKMTNGISLRFPSLSRKYIKVLAYTNSSKKMYMGTVDKNIQDMLLKHAKKI